MLLFTNDKNSSIKALNRLLQAYEHSSRQQVNREKSCFYPSKWVQGHRLTLVARRLGCSAKRFPLIYLGASLIKGRCKGIYFEDLVNKFANPITGWKAKFISFAGKAKSPNPHTLLLSNSKKNHCSNRGTYESIPVESIRPASHHGYHGRKSRQALRKEVWQFGKSQTLCMACMGS